MMEQAVAVVLFVPIMVVTVLVLEAAGDGAGNAGG